MYPSITLKKIPFLQPLACLGKSRLQPLRQRVQQAEPNIHLDAIRLADRFIHSVQYRLRLLNSIPQQNHKLPPLCQLRKA